MDTTQIPFVRLPGLEKPTTQQLEQRYNYHPPKGNQGDRYEFIRRHVLECAKRIVEASPASKEQEYALHALDMAMMYANAAIARNE